MHKSLIQASSTENERKVNSIDNSSEICCAQMGAKAMGNREDYGVNEAFFLIKEIVPGWCGSVD